MATITKEQLIHQDEERNGPPPWRCVNPGCEGPFYGKAQGTTDTAGRWALAKCKYCKGGIVRRTDRPSLRTNITNEQSSN